MIKYIFMPVLTATLLLVCHLLSAQNVGIGTAFPNASAQLDISSTTKGLLIPRLTTSQRTAIAAPANGLMVYDTDFNAFWFYNGSAWSSVGSGAASQWTATGNNIYNSNTGNVGIGTTSPLYKVDVAGGVHSTGTSIFEGFLSVGGSFSPTYELQVIDGSVALYNTTDLKYWTMNYSSGSNVLQLSENGSSPRLVIANGGNVGIGTTTPDYAFRCSGCYQG